MFLSRRTFIHSLGATLALAAFVDVKSVIAQKGQQDLFPIPVETYSEPLFSMTLQQFEAIVGQRFTVLSPDGVSTELTLTEVTRIEPMTNTIRGFYGESYSLIFVNSRKERLIQDIYEFQTEGLSQFSALLVPTDRAQRQYQVIVNRVTR